MRTSIQDAASLALVGLMRPGKPKGPYFRHWHPSALSINHGKAPAGRAKNWRAKSGTKHRSGQ